MKKEEKAQAQIITGVLLILLVLASIVVVWVVFQNLVEEQSEDISITPFTATMQIEDVKVYLNNSVKVILRKDPGKGEITKVRFFFYDKQGTSEFIDRSEIPEELELKEYIFAPGEAPDEINIKIDKVSAVPFYQNKIGIEVSEVESKILKNESGDRMVYIYDDLPISSPGDLVSWWEFESDASDSIGKNHGSLIYGAQIINEELVLDGDDYVSIPDNVEMELGDSGTITFWFKISEWLIYEKLITKDIEFSGECSSSYDYSIHISDESRRMGVTICDGNSGNNILDENGNLFEAGKWYHATIINENGNLKVYVNGNFVYSDDSGDYILSDNSQEWLIGKGHSYYFDGSIDNIMIFNKPLDNNQIKALYENQMK